MKLIRMNERILEFNAQADKYAWEKIGEKYDESRSLNWEWEDTKMEKFAELIVRECADIWQEDCRSDKETLEGGREMKATEYERQNTVLRAEIAALRFDAERYGRVKQFLQHGNGSTLDARGTDSAAFDALVDTLPKEEGK